MQGPKGENLGAIIQPLPYSYLIFRAPSEAAGKCWMDALELALKCSSLLIKTMAREREALGVEGGGRDAGSSDEATQSLRRLMNESDCEQHFRGCGTFNAWEFPSEWDDMMLIACVCCSRETVHDV